MKVYALLSWYAEDPDHLRRVVRSLKGFADVLVAVDGAYATFPGREPWSDPSQRQAITREAREAGFDLRVHIPAHRWDSEVHKRATMFEYGRQAGATFDDWFLIIDADMSLARFTPEARDLLATTKRDVAEVRWHDVQINGKPCSTYRFRSMFRALRGLTVERTHFLYTVPDKTQATGRRFLWHLPSGHLSDEPTLDLSEHVTLHHYNSGRDPGRRQRALDYYKDRDARTLESAGDWR